MATMLVPYFRPSHAFINKQHAVAILFHLEKAFDTMWKFGIIKDLFNFGLRVCIHFCRLRNLNLDPDLMLNGTALPVVQTARFLGILLDSKLSFVDHSFDIPFQSFDTPFQSSVTPKM
uniref:Reverse transcriptase domain-containing protein n=1 Tax=Strigamia maritima TaxID=126957 RepID=T1JC56_STRMM